ncbi:MAG: Hint domain-containing protein [Cognatishimia sp.]|nr:Hint domain-containing protein [Cognatishimia sp.]
MPTNLIINGTFDQGNEGWSGTDLETNHHESAYLGNGSNNRVAEMDGNRGQTTVMEQSFEVPNPTATELTLDAALRNAALPDRGSDGFSVEILDADGAVIASETIFPDTNTYESFSVPVDFPSSGTYTLRLTEIGDNDSLGPIIDNVSLMICFAGGTFIEMGDGTKRAIRDIAVGESVMTPEGPQEVRWVGRRQVSLAEQKTATYVRPILIKKGAFGYGLPERDLYVSRQHRMLVKSPVAGRMFGKDEVLVAAVRLVGLPGVEAVDQVEDLDYVHLLFDRHAIVFAEGAPSESLLVRRETLSSLSPAARVEISALFPDLIAKAGGQTSARVIPRLAAQNTLVSRLQKNGRPMLELGHIKALRRIGKAAR